MPSLKKSRIGLSQGNIKVTEKGQRELHGLNCSINYDRTKEQEREPPGTGAGGAGFNQQGRKEIPGGSLPIVPNEDGVLECLWVRGNLLEIGPLQRHKVQLALL